MPRPLLTRSAATVIAVSALVLCGLYQGGAAASVARARQADAGLPVSVAITSVTPAYARPGQTVTVSGTLTNTSAAPISGLSIQLRSSGTPFSSRSLLQEYADGTYLADEPVGTPLTLTRALAPQATEDWSVALTGSELPMSSFGVYPLAAQADGSDQAPLTVSRTFLPFWPGQKGLDPQRQEVAWVWPLIDQPRQAMCAGLLDNDLAASFRTGGRLYGLLEAGSAYTISAHLTWAIDPALLANATTMLRPYRAGGDAAGCRGGQQEPASEPASQAAAAWLTQLKAATAGQSVFVTPYDDADIAALTRSGLTTDLSRAFSQGRAVAGQVLGDDFSASAAGTAASTNGMAWPADGIANRMDLANLAATDGISTVVLDSSTMPPAPQQNYTPSAQATVPDGHGSRMNVLLSDDTITQVLASANSASDSQAMAFSVAQRYLAETAMIAAERPNLARSIVVAPPQRWDPPAGLAGQLLAETVSAPWLKPVSLSQLAATRHPAGQVTRRPPRAVSRAQLGGPLLDQVRGLDAQVRLLKSIQLTADPALDRAIFAIESSAWRGGGQAGQQAATLEQQFSGYLAHEQAKLKIIVTPREQLVGRTGTVPVSISNRLPYAVKVKLQVAPGGGITVKKQPRAVVVPAGQQVLLKVGVTASAVGSSTLTLDLLTPTGMLLPDAHASMTIQATHYGTLALVIIAAVLGLFLIFSGIRTIRRRTRGGGAGPDPADPPGPRDADPAPQEADADPPEWGDEPKEPDTVVSDRIKPGRTSRERMATGHDPAEESNDYAWTPGRTDRR
jgi:hypothetical protein